MISSGPALTKTSANYDVDHYLQGVLGRSAVKEMTHLDAMIDLQRGREEESAPDLVQTLQFVKESSRDVNLEDHGREGMNFSDESINLFSESKLQQLPEIRTPEKSSTDEAQTRANQLTLSGHNYLRSLSKVKCIVESKEEYESGSQSPSVVIDNQGNVGHEQGTSHCKLTYLTSAKPLQRIVHSLQGSGLRS